MLRRRSRCPGGEGKIDLMLSDVEMDGMNGIELGSSDQT